jgi:hypothetical protein
LIILMAAILSSYNGVGSVCGKPSSARIERRYLAILAAATAAMNSASVELVAVVGWVLERYAMAPPARVKA